MKKKLSPYSVMIEDVSEFVEVTGALYQSMIESIQATSTPLITFSPDSDKAYQFKQSARYLRSMLIQMLKEIGMNADSAALYQVMQMDLRQDER